MAFTTFSTALSGLGNNTQGLNVVGNNLANLNTVGFKTTNISFMDVLGESLAGGQVGLGAAVNRVAATFTQGGLETTNNPTDVAIQGPGFFVVSDGVNQLYTRAGNFHIDKDGELVSATGKEVQGYARDPVTGLIDTNAKLRTVKVPSTTGNSNATSEFELVFNLDASAPIGSTFSTSLQIYDSLGDVHLGTVDFVKDAVTATQTDWKFDVTIPHSEFLGVASTSTDKFSLLTGAIATSPPAAGTLVFDSNGKLSSAYLGATPATLPPVANLKVPPTAVTIPSFSNGGTMDPNGMSWKLLAATGDLNVTGLTALSNVTFSAQDGVPPGNMESLKILPDGTISGVFSNGLALAIAKIAIAQFNNENGLIQQGQGLFSESLESGSLLLGTPGANGAGLLVGGALELSNVDLATEFTKLITYQRGFQANARMISLTDQVLQETLNMRQ